MKKITLNIIAIIKSSRWHRVIYLLVIIALFTYGISFWNYEVRLKEKSFSTITSYLDVERNSLNWYNIRTNLVAFDLPFIVVNKNNKPVDWNGIHKPLFKYFLGKPIGLGYLEKEEKEILTKNCVAFSKINNPIIFNATIKNKRYYKIYYGNPLYSRGFFFFPILQLILIIALVSSLLLWRKNRTLRKNSNLWVGLAKETAHQLGTPLTAIAGWVEIIDLRLKSFSDDNINKQDIEEAIDEMKSDIQRLNKALQRFSKIGSKPTLSQHNLNETLQEVVAYFRHRIPQTGKKIQIVANYAEIPNVNINKDMIGWVVENLIKNAIDAMRQEEGVIQIETSINTKENTIILRHSDNGHGIKRELLNKIFEPGYSTKKCGWGVGLALAKRIITEFHGGKIYIESSRINRGTTFVVELPIA